MIAAPEPTIVDKVAFLSGPGAYPHPAEGLIRKETHMSWVFLAGESVYKLKKPVRFPYLDFSTLARREAACRE
jgi:aminoglycoside phosphotransferase family enzyme